MPFDEGLAQRIRESLGGARVTEKMMFGGIAFLSRGHMFVGISREALIVRVGPDAYAASLKRPHAREMDFTGRPMKGYVFVDAAGFERCRSPRACSQETLGLRVARELRWRTTVAMFDVAVVQAPASNAKDRRAMRSFMSAPIPGV